MSGAKRKSDAGPSSSRGGDSSGAGGSSKRARAVIQDLERLKCPICLEFPRAEVYLCPNGHSVCSSCIEKLTNCPSCRAPYMTGRGSDGGRQRNHMTEDILNTVLFDCSWREQGCNREGLSRQQLSEHEGQCEHNPNPLKVCQMLLPGSDCAYEVAPAFFKTPVQEIPADFRQHLLDSHQINFSVRFSGQKYNRDDDVVLLASGGEPFFLGNLLQLKKGKTSPDSLGYFMNFAYKDYSVADPRLSCFLVRITDKPQGFSVSVKFTLKSYTPPSANNAGEDDVPNIETSWNGRIMGLREFNEFKNKAVGEREKFKFSLPMSEIREYYLNAKGKLIIWYEFTVTPIN